jgi:hypothetical protein
MHTSDRHNILPIRETDFTSTAPLFENRRFQAKRGGNSEKGRQQLKKGGNSEKGAAT